MLSHASRSRSSVNIWPGFVDMLASVLLVFIFMLMIFVVAQFFLADLASSRFGAIDQLSANVHALLEELGVEKEKADTIRKDMEALRRNRDQLNEEIASLANESEAQTRYSQELEARLAAEARQVQLTREELAQRDARIQALDLRVDEQDASLNEARALGADAAAEMAKLNRQLANLRQLFSRVSSALSASERSNERYKLEMDDLGQRLNVALAEKVESLTRFRSDFFGRMREVLGNREDIQISGDRFVFQSEVLFASGSAELEPAGRVQLDRLAETLQSVSKQIPPDVDWILRVDGHTDRRPIATSEFPSNWELSTARALSIVRHLIGAGIPPHRLAAAGFGEFRPLDDTDSAEAYARNRRIEIKVTGP